MSFIDLAITITGDDTVAAGAARVLTRGGDAQQAEVEPLGERYTRRLIEATPRGRGPASGRRRLAESYDEEGFYSPTQAEYRITNATPHIGYVLKGRDPVEAKPGKMLRFEIDGQVFYRKRVGGADANPFDERVRREMQSDIDGLAERTAARVAQLYRGG